MHRVDVNEEQVDIPDLFRVAASIGSRSGVARFGDGRETIASPETVTEPKPA